MNSQVSLIDHTLEDITDAYVYTTSEKYLQNNCIYRSFVSISPK